MIFFTFFLFFLTPPLLNRHDPIWYNTFVSLSGDNKETAAVSTSFRYSEDTEHAANVFFGE